MTEIRHVKPSSGSSCELVKDGTFSEGVSIVLDNIDSQGEVITWTPSTSKLVWCCTGGYAPLVGSIMDLALKESLNFVTSDDFEKKLLLLLPTFGGVVRHLILSFTSQKGSMMKTVTVELDIRRLMLNMD